MSNELGWLAWIARINRAMTMAGLACPNESGNDNGMAGLDCPDDPPAKPEEGDDTRRAGLDCPNKSGNDIGRESK